MLIRSGLRAAIPAALIAACLAGCTADTGGDLGGDVPSVDPSAAIASEAAAQKAPRMPAPPPTPTLVIQDDPNVPKPVRDAFSGLQATYKADCTPEEGNCARFLGRVNDELGRLDRAMKAGKKGPGRFDEPIAWMGTLRAALDGDASAPNLEKHRTELIGTRDSVNTWMQVHWDDYR
ncbi:hypothetical protein [Streptomyces clavifer]|uniref:hypothetical protein n=1 Tax=Streptomyces clavifer TaxID=68188 RepID=UPI0036699AC5